jgi:hypothetical protein
VFNVHDGFPGSLSDPSVFHAIVEILLGSNFRYLATISPRHLGKSRSCDDL